MPCQPPQVRLVPATVPLLGALDEDRTRIGELFGSPAPDGWPEFPEAIGFTVEHLEHVADEKDPEVGTVWEWSRVRAGRVGEASNLLGESGSSWGKFRPVGDGFPA